MSLNMNNILDTSKHIKLEASAGTGKTFSLSLRIINLLFQGVSPSEILCITFTNKATDEIVSRVIYLLKQFKAGEFYKEDGSKTPEFQILQDFYSDLKGVKGEDIEPFIQKKAAITLEQLFKDFSKINIKTIDAFLGSILKIFPYETDISSKNNIASTSQVQELQKEAIYSILEEFIGTNKNAVVIDMLDEAFEYSLDSLQELLEGLTGKSIELMESLLSNHNQGETSEQLIQKSQEAAYKGIHHKKQILLKAEQFCGCYEHTELKKLAQGNINKIKIALKTRRVTDFFDIPFIKEKNIEKSRLKESPDMLDRKIFYELLEELEAWLESYEKSIVALVTGLFGEFFKVLDGLKRQKQLYTFDDIQLNVYKLLAINLFNEGLDESQQSESKDYFYFRLDGKISHILIDEFQDTSKRQFEIFLPLIHESMSGYGQNDTAGSFFFVGDPKQTLYRFRGSSPDLFEDTLNIIDTAIKGGRFLITEESLVTNYRSDKEIIGYVNRVFGELSEKGIYNNIFHTQVATEHSKVGYVEHKVVKASSRSGKSGEKSIKEVMNDFSLESIQKLLKKGYTYGDIAILTYQKSKLENIGEYLSQNDIPIEYQKNRDLNTTLIYSAMKALLSYLAFKDRLFIGEYALINPSLINLQEGDKESVIDAIQARIDRLVEKNSQTSISYYNLVFHILEQENFGNRFKGDYDYYGLLDVLSGLSSENSSIGFLQKFLKVSEGVKSVQVSKKNAIILSTIHNSKGLEFPAVIMPDLAFESKLNSLQTKFLLSEKSPEEVDIQLVWQKKYHHYLSSNAKESYSREIEANLADNLNMLYVALTRAEHALFTLYNKYEPKASSTEQEVGIKVIDTVEKILLHQIEGFSESMEFGELKEFISEKSSENQEKKEITLNVKDKKLLQNIEISKELKTGKSLHKVEKNNYLGELYGVMLHKIIFFLNNYNQEEVELITNKVFSKHGSYAPESYKDRLILDVARLLGEESFQELLQKPEIHKEREFYINDSSYIIDFYTVDRDEVTILDFKTGEITEELYNKYEKQLNQYSYILKSRYNRPVYKKIVNIYNNKVEFIDI